jgi:glyoxylase I family protein
MPKFDFAIHHASLIVANTQASLLFYSGILGMEQMERPDLGFPGAWLKLGEQQIHLLELSNPDPTTGRPEHGGRDRHVAMTVSDLEPVKQALDAASFRYTVSKSGRKALFCRDPDGNAIEIIDRSQFKVS